MTSRKGEEAATARGSINLANFDDATHSPGIEQTTHEAMLLTI